MRYWPALLCLSLGCEAPDQPLPLETRRGHLSIEAVAMETCDTPPELVEGLSRQLVDAINCLRPGTLEEIPLGDGVQMLRPGRPNVVDGRGLDDLLRAADAGGRRMVVRWAYRDVALQHLFWLQDDFRGCAVAAPAGLSNHQNGLAVDLDDQAFWSPIMGRFGWHNQLPNDRVHFDYLDAPDVGLGALSLLAFQALWNKNHPERPVPTSAELDGDTYAALGQAPIEGFALDLCDGGAPPIGPGPVRGPTVGQAAWRGCDAPVDLLEGLSVQVVEAMNCLQPDALEPLGLCAGPGCINLAPDALPFLGAPARRALAAAVAADDGTLVLDDAFRDVTLQHFYASADANIACPEADGAARSPFNTGLSVGSRATPVATRILRAAGFEGAGSVFTYRGADADDLTPLGVLAFQRLWNHNRADDPIDEDGLIGPQTRGAIDRAPVAGFPRGLCEGPPRPDAGLGPDAGGRPRDAGPPPRDAGPPADAEGPTPDGGLEDAGVASMDGRVDREVSVGPFGVLLPPAPGWTALAEDGGCRQAPAGGWPWGLLALAAWIRRPRRG